MFFDQVQQGPHDVMYQLKIDADNDAHLNKVDLGVGIYRNETGSLHELSAVNQAKKKLAEENPNHDYEVTTGNSDFVHHAADLIFGSDSEAVKLGNVASAQTISGTGAIHIALMFLSNSDPNSGLERTVFVGTPTWGNIVPMCKLTGLEIKTYNHYLPKTGQVDWESILSAVSSAPKGSIFYLQGCCHNPTSADFSHQQWEALAVEMKARQLLPLFDVAYHGLGDGIDEDAFCIRHFARMGPEMLVCQSFSKNFGLYGERVGAVHAVCEDARAALAVHDQFRFLIRSEFGSSPIYGARIVATVLRDPVSKAAWRSEVESLHQRIQTLRKVLYALLQDVYKTPGNWTAIINGAGLFSLLPLSPDQCSKLRNNYHIYLVPTGRITIPGLNEKNLDYVAKSIDSVVRST